MSGNLFDWSTTAGSNTTADGDINWAEGQDPNTVNDSARQMMGRIAEFLEDLCGTQTVGGTANAITVTLDSGFTTLANKRIMALRPTADNTGAVTINVNSIGAKAIRKFDRTGDVALASGDLQSGGIYLLVYSTSANSSAGAWVCLNPTQATYQNQSDLLDDIAALTPTDGGFIVGNGTDFVLESGADARTSLGLGTAATTASTAYATAAQGTKADGAAQATDLASTSASKGASLVGVQDSAGNFTATTVEAVLAEIATNLAAAGIGVGQTWQDVSASRAADGTIYQNTTGKPIQLKVTFTNGTGAFLYESADESTWNEVGKSVASAFQICYPIIPPNHYYKATGGQLNQWSELR